MSIFSKFSKSNKELESCLTGVINNAANNYKDAAQKHFKEFNECFARLKEGNQLTEKQIAYYEEVKAKYDKELAGFHH